METSPEKWMQEALKEAKTAQDLGEVPVGAVIVYQGEIISRAHNRVEKLHDATAHAELLAIRQASELLGNWRLSEASLVVTMEPCVMCTGALILSRIKDVYFGCYDENLGALGSLFDLSQYAKLPNTINVYPELLAKESKLLLSRFFQEQRAREKNSQ